MIGTIAVLSPLLLAVALPAATTPPQPAVDATRVIVTTPMDVVPGDRQCSLREAVRAIELHATVDTCVANRQTTTVFLPALEENLSYRLGSSPLMVGADVAIVGAPESPTVSGYLRVSTGASLNLDDIRFVSAAGAISEVWMVNRGTARLNRVSLTNFNYFEPEAGMALVVNVGKMTMAGVDISDVGGGPLGILYNGPGGDLVMNEIRMGPTDSIGRGQIFNRGHAMIAGTVVHDTTTFCPETQCGNGVYNARGARLRMVDASVSDNAGGIVNEGGLILRKVRVGSNSDVGLHNAGTLNASRLTIDSNADTGLINSGEATPINSTVAANIVGCSFENVRTAGGILNAGDVQLRNVTVAHNGAQDQRSDVPQCPPVSPAFVAGLNNDRGHAVLGNTLIARNDGGNASGGLDCRGSLFGTGWNLVANMTGCSWTGTTVGNVVGRPALLGSLKDRDVTSRFVPPLVGSPAIDAGNPAPVSWEAAACNAIDTRNVPRPRDGDGDGRARCDIGAVEK